MNRCNSVRQAVKTALQKLTGITDVSSYFRTQKLRLAKVCYRRPITSTQLRQALIKAGVTPGKTLWVQSSWNQFYNVDLKPTELVDLLLELIGPQGTLAMPAFPLDKDPSRVLMIDRAPVSTGLLCEVFRRRPDVQRSIHLTSSVCALGPNANYLVRDHHLSPMTWGPQSPYYRLKELDACLLILGGGLEFMTPLHVVECLLCDEIPYFRKVFGELTHYRWKRASGETGESTACSRLGDIRPVSLRRHLGSDIYRETKLSNLRIFAADAGPFIDRVVALGRKGITMYINPTPGRHLFTPFENPSGKTSE